jgi:hypothetical protein
MTIKKVGSKFQLISSTGKNLGTFPTKEAAEKRERQVKFFKNTKKTDSMVRLADFKQHLLQHVGEDYDMQDDEQREAASCLYIAVEELQREDHLREIAGASDRTLEQLMADAKPELDDGTRVDLASGAAGTCMLVIERKRDNLETGNLMGLSPTGFTNEHDHMYNSLVAGFTTPWDVDGHVHWVDVRRESTGQGGAGYHIHTTQPFEVQRDDLIILEEDEITRRGDFGGIVLSERDVESPTMEFDGLFTGIDRASHPTPEMEKGKKKKDGFREQTKATDRDPARRGLPMTTRERERGNLLNNLSSRETRSRDRQDEQKKRNESAG